MEAIIQSFIHAFGWSIIHSLWQGALIYSILFAVILAIPKLSPSTKHNLSYISISAIFIWFIITFINYWSYTANTSLANDFQPGSPVITESIKSFHFSLPEIWFPAITLIYLVGFALHLFILYKGYIIIRKLRTSELQDIPKDWENILFKNIARLDIQKNIAFHLSGIANTPMVIGYLKPIILFPVSMWNSLDLDQVEAIIIHELTHIKRNDYLLNQIKMFIDSILFFNPFVWLIGQFIKKEREHICDDVVSEHTGNPLRYAETLLKLELLRTAYHPTTAVTLIGQKEYLFNRIKHITIMKSKSINVKQQLAGISLFILSICCLAWFAPAKSSQGINEKEASNSTNAIHLYKSGINNSLHNATHSDTIIIPKNKSGVKIFIKDKAGNRKEYNSIEEVPDSLKKNNSEYFILADSIQFWNNDLSKEINKTFNSHEFLKQQSEISKQFNSPEFKKSQQDLIKQFISPEFRNAQQDIAKQFNLPEHKGKLDNFTEQFKLPKYEGKIDDFTKQFNSSEFKNQIEDFTRQIKSPEFKNKLEDLTKQFNSPEFKKQQEELFKNLTSPEFKKNQQELIEKLISPEFKIKQEELIEK